ncbi:MAG: aromatic ring-hydroxylating dioxygenase subunit alpha [Gammaproteobacteria bacterium]
MSHHAFQHFTHRGKILHGLPPCAYTDAGFHARENERLFARAWTFAGFAHELPRRGDVMPVSVAGQPILLLRNQSGIAAFHNICRHRCLKLVDQPGNVGKLIRCPYHAWAYDLSGALRATPFFGGVENNLPDGFRPQDHGLLAVRCAVWHDWVFVNPDGAAMAFAEFIAPLEAQLANWDLTQLAPLAVLDFGAVGANWKFLMENFIEPYHVQFVHATTTKQPLADHAPFIDRHCLGCSVKLPAKPRDGQAGMTSGAAAGGALAVDSSYFTLFPNFVLATYAPDQLGVHLNTPLDAAHTRQRRAIYLLREARAGEAAELENLWRKVHAEDHAMCERLQQGRQSAAAADGGRLSPVWEISVRRFQELVYDALGTPAAPNPTARKP